MKNRIAELRKKAELTQTQLADIVKVQQSTLSHWETGTYDADVESLIKLSNYFGVPVDYIICNDTINSVDNIYAGAFTFLQNERALSDAILQKYGSDVSTIIDIYSRSSMPRQGKIFKIINDISEHGISDHEIELIFAYRSHPNLQGIIDNTLEINKEIPTQNQNLA